ncbi:MAG: ATP-binding protein [Flavobacteriales bacterium]|nr:ATP-binding protein [Flavobacteriales bacterium]
MAHTRALLMVCLLLCTGTALTQPAARIFRHLTIADGLSQNSVNVMVQDRDGFLWVGTQDGLDRYDGRGFVTYRHEARPNSIANNYIWSLLEDADGHLWIGTFGGGLDRLDLATGTITHHQHRGDQATSLSGDRVIGLLEHPAGTIWVRTTSGLDRIDGATGEPTRILEKEFAKGDLIGAMAPRDEHRLLLRTGRGMAELDVRTRALKVVGSDPSVTALLRTDGRSYVLENHRLLVIDAESGKQEVLVDARVLHGADPRIGFQCVLVHEGHIWIGTTHGLIHRAPTGRTSIHRHDPNDPRSLADDHVLSLLAGRGGEIWVGTRNGLDRIEHVEPMVHGMTHVPGDPTTLPHASVTCLLDDGERLWVGSPAGLALWDRVKNRMSLHRHDAGDRGTLSADYVLSLARNKKGEVLVGTLGGGVQVARDEGTATRFERIDAPPSADPQRSAIVHGLWTARDGRTWIATGGAGLCSIGADGAMSCLPATGEGALPHPYLFTVMEDDAGHLWMGSAGGGLLLFEPKSGRSGALRRNSEDMGSLSDDLVLCTHRDREGFLWVGTANGLCRTQRPIDDSLRASILAGREVTGIFQRYGRANGLPNEVIYGVVADGERLWLSTNGGLVELDRGTGEVARVLSKADGLTGDESNQNAYLRAADGTLFFGGPHGLNWFDPKELITNRKVPPVLITRFLLNNEPVALASDSAPSDFALGRAIHRAAQLSLSWRYKVIGFEFAALNYIAPEKNRYRYRLEGFDEAWIEAGTRNSVTYTNLDPGAYVLRVQACNNDGIWNAEGASLSLSISAPPWRTWYAYLFYALVLFSIGYAWYRYRLREATRALQTELRITAARSQEREDFRRKSAADFHDESGAKLTRINMHIGLAKQHAGEEAAIGPHLEHIEQAQRELSAGIRDLIWSMDPGRDTLSDVLDRIAAFALPLFDRTETCFKLEGRTEALNSVKMDMERRRAITLILKEALNNCAKHAQARHCTLQVSRADGRLSFVVRDDGQGFDPSATPNGYGMRTMPERAKGIGAELVVESKPGAGTVVRVGVPG